MGSGTGSPLIPPGRQRTHWDIPDRDCGVGIAESRGDVQASWSIINRILEIRLPVLRRLAPDSDWRCALKMSAIKFKRAISTGKLNALPRLHIRPINVVVYHGS